MPDKFSVEVKHRTIRTSFLQAEGMGVDLGSSSAVTTKQRTAAKQPTAGSAAREPPVKPTPSPTILSIVAGDASLVRTLLCVAFNLHVRSSLTLALWTLQLMAAAGIVTVAASGLVSLAMVAVDDKLTSVTELRLFSTSMITGSVLFTGALKRLLWIACAVY
jgi:hypothetical protein